MRKLIGVLALMAGLLILASPLAAQDAKTKKDIADSLQFFKSEKSTDRAFAMVTLGLVGKQAKGVTRTVVEGLLDSSPEVKKYARASIPMVNSTIAEPVLNLIDGDTYEKRLEGVQGLASLGPDGLPAMPALLVFLRQAKMEDRGTVVKGIAAVGIKDEPTAVLIANMALRDPDAGIRAAAQEALPKMEFANQQLPLFLAALGQENDPALKVAVIKVLVKLGGLADPKVVGALEDIVKKEKNQQVVAEAKAALKK